MSKGPRVIVKDHGLSALFKTALQLRAGAHVKVGVLADSAQGGLHEEGGELTVAEIAAVNEFGTEDGRVPARSFIQRTFDEKREALTKEFAALLGGKVLFGAMTLANALGLVGAQLAAEIKKRVTAGDPIPPPNAPSTVEKKGSDRPLIDTGRMVNAVTWLVQLGRGE